MKWLVFLLFVVTPTLTWAEDGQSSTDPLIKQLVKRAKTNDPDAEFNLGNIYHEGQGVKKDVREALKWYERAAEHGIVEARMMVGISYWTGLDGKMDEKRGVKWFKKAAEEGEPGAFFYLAAAYDLGKGVKQDYVKCYMWTLVFKGSGGGAIPKDTADVEEKIKDLEGKLTKEQITEGKRLAEKAMARLRKKPRFLETN